MTLMQELLLLLVPAGALCSAGLCWTAATRLSGSVLELLELLEPCSEAAAIAGAVLVEYCR